MSAYAASMSLRKLFSILLALAVLLAPGVTGAAMAAAPDHQMPMMAPGHCQSQPAGTAQHNKMDGKNCCIAMCAAVAVAPATPAEALAFRQQMAEFAPPRSYHGLHAEIATPPPRRS